MNKRILLSALLCGCSTLAFQGARAAEYSPEALASALDIDETMVQFMPDPDSRCRRDYPTECTLKTLREKSSLDFAATIIDRRLDELRDKAWNASQAGDVSGINETITGALKLQTALMDMSRPLRSDSIDNARIYGQEPLIELSTGFLKRFETRSTELLQWARQAREAVLLWKFKKAGETLSQFKPNAYRKL